MVTTEQNRQQKHKIQRKGNQSILLHKIIHTHTHTKGSEKESSKGTTKQKTMKTMTCLNPYSSIITLNVIGLNSPIKSQKVAQWIINKTQLYVLYKRITLTLRI